MIPLTTDKDVESYLVNALHLDIGAAYYQHFEDKTQLVVELNGKITLKQLRQIEKQTMTILDSIFNQSDDIHSTCHIDLVFMRV